MNEATRMQQIYDILNIKNKLTQDSLRLIYLKDFLGLDQKTIALCEGLSQGHISRALRVAKQEYFHQNNLPVMFRNMYSLDDLKALHFSKRSVITDIQLVAFMENLLGINIDHPFYRKSKTNFIKLGRRSAALKSLGVQQKRVAEIFNRATPTVSLAIKKLKEGMLDETDYQRYESEHTFRIVSKQEIPLSKIILAGGQ